MVFSTYQFFFAFFPVVFLTYRLLIHCHLHEVSRLWLVLSSFFFFSQGSPAFLPYFLGSVTCNYVIGITIQKSHGHYARRNQRILLLIGLAQNIALLGYYKYTDFFIQNWNMASGQTAPFRNILLPIGISFFTFQLIAWLLDCYRGEAEAYSVMDYLLFITFFPQLIVGPIVHHKDVVPQFSNPEQSFFNQKNVMLGIYVFSIGCAKKILLADPLTAHAEVFWADMTGTGSLDALLASLCYTFSYYFDLSGYVDMAIGLGLFFNIHLPQNFNSPYKSRNFRDYWRTWHMTLSRFLSDYVFRSLFKKGDHSTKFYMAVMATFLVSGFWHGAGWRFVLWGSINGLFVCMAHTMARRNWHLPKALAWTLTFMGIVGTRILFVSGSTRQAVDVLKILLDVRTLFGDGLISFFTQTSHFAAYNLYTLAVLFTGMGIAFFAKNTRELAENFQPNWKTALGTAACLVPALFQMSAVSDFLYLQF